MAHKVETMAYALDSGVPWHGLGVGVETAQTSKEMLRLARLNWQVKIGPVYAGPRRMKVEDVVCTYRDSDNKVLGFPSPSYVPFQNEDAFVFLDSLVADGVMTYDTAGSLFGGKKVWVLAKMEKGWTVRDDKFHQYVLLTTKHDGTGSVQITNTEVRAVCDNTVQAALLQSNKRGRNHGVIRIIHSATMDERLDAARSLLTVTTESQRRLQEFLKAAAACDIKEYEVAAVQTAIFGSLDEKTPTQRKKAIDAFRRIYAEESQRNGNTAYSLFNTVTGFGDHARRYQGEGEIKAEHRFISIFETWGQSYLLKAKGLSVIDRMVEAIVPV
jgi:phage/plasmid-like protein (TIGR03299 family)